jgi:hypothetical protein
MPLGEFDTLPVLGLFLVWLPLCCRIPYDQLIPMEPDLTSDRRLEIPGKSPQSKLDSCQVTCQIQITSHLRGLVAPTC